MRKFLFFSIVILLAATADNAWSAGFEASRDRTCDSDGPVANLDFTLKDINGKSVSLSDYKGKVLLVDFWATWCAACKIEIPAFMELNKKYAPQGFAIVGVSVDDPVAKLKAFAKELKMDYPVLVGSGRTDVLEAFGSPTAFPTTFVIGRDGKVCKAHAGYTPKEQFDLEIRELLWLPESRGITF